MALETLKGVEEIGGFPVNRFPDDPEKLFIGLIEEANTICFKLQSGPVKEVGVNGCQVVTMMETCLLMIEKLDDKFPCSENAHTVKHLKEAIAWQEIRTRDREARNVEGTSNV